MQTSLGSREDQLQKANFFSTVQKEVKQLRISSLKINGIPREGATEVRKRKGKPRSV